MLRLSQHEELEWINEGDVPTVEDLQAGLVPLHPEAKGYPLCANCGRILTFPAPAQRGGAGRRRAQARRTQQDPYGHSELCPSRGIGPNSVALATRGKGEVLRLLVPVPASDDEDQFKSWGLSLGYSLLLGMRHVFMLADGEIDFELEGPWSAGDPNLQLVSLTFIDPSLGGTGYLRKIAEQFHLVAQRSILELDHPNCESACYRCLKAYQNQRYHEFLRWPMAIDSLEILSSTAPQERPSEVGDIEDPRPWLQAYSAGVGSPLEYQFLQLFERSGFAPQRQVPVPSNHPISVADFAIPETRVAIYIDSASFHSGTNLRRDRQIRARLKEGPESWYVEELRAADLAKGASLVERLRELGRGR